jgi:putative oxidoreductase
MIKDIALLLLRLTGIGLAVAHGWGKVSALATGGGDRFIGGVEALGFPLPALFAWAAALAEFGGGLFVALGIGARVSAAFAASTMFVAAFARHKFHLHLLVSLGLMRASPDVVKGWGNPEMALIYLVCFLAIVLMGGGRFSLDHLVLKRRK